jgi:hypothetical protein
MTSEIVSEAKSACGLRGVLLPFFFVVWTLRSAATCPPRNVRGYVKAIKSDFNPFDALLLELAALPPKVSAECNDSLP